MQERSSQLVDNIYEAGAISETWPKVLQELSDLYGCTGSVLFAFGASGSHSWIASPDLKPLLEEFIRDGWSEKNQKPQRIAALNYSGFINDLDVFTPEEIDKDPVYAEFYAPRSLGWAAGTIVPTPSGDTLIFSLERAFRKGPFEDTELIALDELRPHLARAALLSSRLAMKRVEGMTMALEAVGLPAAVLQSGGKLYAANSLFQNLIPSIILDMRGRVSFANRNADSLLYETLQRLAVNGAAGQSRSIAIPRSEEQLPMIAHVAPVRGIANDIFLNSLALMIVTPVDRNTVPNAEVLQGLFDLTPAEARVARAIAEGKTVEAIALANGLSRETIRSQLAATLGKTGLKRQAELAALLGGLTIPL
jgi:DNA-binding CsgD family transcriptional regulator